jgi:hypothetical protein
MFFINDESAGGKLGSTLGSALAGGLQALAQSKMQGYQQQRTLHGLNSMGFTPQESSFYSQNPQLLELALKQKQESKYNQGLYNLLSGLGQQQGSISQEVNPTTGIPTPSVNGGNMGGLGALRQFSDQAQIRPQDAFKLVGLQQAQRANESRESIANQRLQQAERFHQDTQEQKKLEHNLKVNAITKPERKEILTAAKSAKENIARLDRMQTLSDKGKLNSPLYVEFLKKTGLDIPALTNPDTQEFKKLEVDFLRDAKNIFGSRVTNYEMSTFLKAIPSLSQSPEGRSRVIRNLKLFNEGSLARADALKNIIKENKGTIPLDLAEQVEERTAPETDRLLNEFRTGQEGSVKRSFEMLPNPSSLNGRRIRDKETGKILQSNGQEWIEVS